MYNQTYYALNIIMVMMSFLRRP